MTSHLFLYFFCIRPIFFTCKFWRSIQLEFLSFTWHIWISIQVNTQRPQWPPPTKAQTWHLQNFMTPMWRPSIPPKRLLLFWVNHVHQSTCQVPKKSKRKHQELAGIVVFYPGGRSQTMCAEGLVCQLHCARLAKGFRAIWIVSIQNIFVEVEKFSFIQKQQSYSLDVISSEETCTSCFEFTDLTEPPLLQISLWWFQ